MSKTERGRRLLRRLLAAAAAPIALRFDGIQNKPRQTWRWLSKMLTKKRKRNCTVDGRSFLNTLFKFSLNLFSVCNLHVFCAQTAHLRLIIRTFINSVVASFLNQQGILIDPITGWSFLFGLNPSQLQEYDFCQIFSLTDLITRKFFLTDSLQIWNN